MSVPLLLVAALLSVSPSPTMRGEVDSTVGSATFDDHSVQGPHVSLIRDSQWEWRGTLGRMTISATETRNGLTGPNLEVTFSHEGGMTVMDGYLGRRRFRFTYLDAGGPRLYYGPAGRRFYDLKGAAAGPNAPPAQMLFSLLGSH